jgi:hypothetical protein
MEIRMKKIGRKEKTCRGVYCVQRMRNGERNRKDEDEKYITTFRGLPCAIRMVRSSTPSAARQMESNRDPALRGHSFLSSRTALVRGRENRGLSFDWMRGDRRCTEGGSSSVSNTGRKVVPALGGKIARP